MRAVAAFLSLLLSASSAHAYLKAGPVGYGHWLKATTVQEGMTTSLAAAYSFRKVRSAYAGSAVKLRRTTGGTQDIGFTASGDFDTAAATTFCLATACFIETWYDQSANARHATQATPANQPDYIASCNGSLPCARTTWAGIGLNSASVTWAAALTSMSTVARRQAGTGLCDFVMKSNNRIGVNATVNNWWTTAYSGGQIDVAAAEGAWHAASAVLNGASSVLRVDGAETAGNVGADGSAGTATINGGAAATTCDVVEGIAWDNYAITGPERLALAENQKNYWMPLPLDTFQTPAAAYSMRRLKSTYSGPGIRLRRASDNAEADINFLGYTGFTGAPLDTAAAAAHCAATTCNIAIWYDQSGNARDAFRIAATGLEYVPACAGGLPCGRASTGTDYVQVASVAWGVAKSTIGVVARRQSGTGVCYWTLRGNNSLRTEAATQWMEGDGAGSLVGPAGAEATFHAGIGVIDGASSAVRVDATETAGTLAGSTASGTLVVGYAASLPTQCDVSESIVWNNYALTAGERAALRANQQSFFGTP